MTKSFPEFLDEYLSKQDEEQRYQQYVAKVMEDRKNGINRELWPIEVWRSGVSFAMGIIGRMFSDIKVEVK